MNNGQLSLKEIENMINIREGYKPITIALASEVVEHGDDE